jgi:Dyp-type peroxidase family
MSINLRDTGIDPRNPRNRPFLQQLQGNILKPHGREYTLLVLLRFRHHRKEACNWLGNLVSTGLITSAWEQFKQTRDFRRGLGAGKTFGSVFLSAQGYVRLGIPQENLPRLFIEAPDRDPLPKVHFRDGMAAARTELNDPPRDAWGIAYQEELHAMLLLADDDVDRLHDVGKRVEAGLDGIATVIGREHGRALRNADGKAIEHFGYADGISQPLFLSRDLARARADHGVTSWDPSAPLGLVLLSDPLAPLPDCFGSYLVYRKLRQNVSGFRHARAQLAKEMNPAYPNEELAGAFAVGRFEDGTPVVLSSCPTGKASNNFNYSSDPGGSRCPVHAHIRKVNPRGGTIKLGSTLAQERNHRIARRGVPYENERHKGLLFMCYQRDISRQFAFLQKQWANNIEFPHPDTGIDPLIGQLPKKHDPPYQTWPSDWDLDPSKPFDFHGFVTLRGGEFFFAPSLAFLSNAEESLEAGGAKFKEEDDEDGYQQQGHDPAAFADDPSGVSE